MEQIPAVITPLDEHMGLDIARSLAKRGIPVYGIDSDPSVPGRYSKCCSFVLGPDPESNDGADYVQFLVDFGCKLGRKAVLYPLSDLHVLICSRHRDILREHYEYVMPEQDTVEGLLTKDGLYAVAVENHIPAPQTIFLSNASAAHPASSAGRTAAAGRGSRPERRCSSDSGNAGQSTCDIEAIANSVSYPVVLKPTESTYWHDPRITRLLRGGLLGAQAKVILCHNPTELVAAYHQIAALDSRLVVQEVIPGEDSRLAYFSFYLDRQSRPLGVFAGRKYRVIPTGFGSASYVRSLHDPELAEIALSLVSATHYQGLGGIEFKKDPRDERYKLIEFNTRFGMWDGLSVKCGVDLPYIAYCDTLHLPVEPQLAYRDNVIWVDWQRDLRAAIAYWRKGQLSFGDWLRSLQGEKMWAIYSRDDWRPGAAFTLTLFRRMWERLRPQQVKSKSSVRSHDEELTPR